MVKLNILIASSLWIFIVSESVCLPIRGLFLAVTRDACPYRNDRPRKMPRRVSVCFSLCLLFLLLFRCG